MPPPLHDTLNLMFRNRPQLAVEMLRDHLGVDVPGGLPVTHIAWHHMLPDA
ncbi:hypothetical protein [Sphaerimonospora mesophila]|uniref:hypothetical protein n=1 Tax=Sphaerimonospora mesophila TaxID=37483 RepID=UPI000AE58686